MRGGIGWILTISLRLRRPALYTLSYNPKLAEMERFERSQAFARHLSGVLPYQLGHISKMAEGYGVEPYTDLAATVFKTA